VRRLGLTAFGHRSGVQTCCSKCHLRRTGRVGSIGSSGHNDCLERGAREHPQFAEPNPCVPIAIIVVALLLALPLFLGWRNQRIEALYLAGMQGDASAVQSLASFSGKQATDSLLWIAFNKDLEFETRHAAFEALFRSDMGSEISSTLSQALVPYESLAVRLLIAEHLSKHGCKQECLRNVLYYQERLWRGDENIEDWFKGSANYRAEQDRLYGKLDEVLRQNTPETLVALDRLYGLNGWNPSLFAIDRVRKLRFEQACGSLLSARNTLTRFGKTSEGQTLREVESAILDLRCTSFDK